MKDYINGKNGEQKVKIMLLFNAKAHGQAQMINTK